MSALYFGLGVLAGGTLGVCVGAVLATGKRADEQSDRLTVEPGNWADAADSLVAAWLAEPAPVCVACRLGECAVHGTQRRNGGAS